MNSPLVAILAAGESRRMGTPKLCLPWKETTVLAHLLDLWKEAGAERVLVIHPQDLLSPVAAELDRLKIPATQRTPTAAPERGMMGSVVTAAKIAATNPGPSHLIIALGDQPHLKMETLRTLLTTCAAAPEKMVRILHHGRPGHPLALPKNLLRDLSITPTPTLRDFLAQHKTDAVDLTCDDSGVLVDMDTPDEYVQRLASAP